MTAPIMRGVDFIKRPFICIKINVDKNTNKYSPFKKLDSALEIIPCVVTFFNRESRGLDFRCALGDDIYLPDHIFGDSSGIKEEEIANIKKLVEQKKLEGTQTQRGINYSYRLAD